MIETLRDAAWNRMRQSWITTLLAGGVFLSWLSLLNEADWPREPNLIMLLALCGASYGALLAVSRFHGRAALWINLVVALGLTFLVVGRVLPTLSVLFSQPFEKSVWLMNTRLLTLWDALSSDMQWLGTQYLTNTQQVVLIYAFIAWNAAAWFMWCVVRRRQALPGILLIALLIAIQTGLTEKTPRVPVSFITCSVLLLARTAFVGQLHEWTHRGRDFPDLIGEDWTASAAALAVAVVLLAGVSTPEWRDSFQRFLDSLTPPPPLTREATPVPLELKPNSENYVDSFVPTLEYVGDPFPTSNDVVFYVSTSDPPSGVDSSGVAQPPRQQHYWRGAIYDKYTGTGWEPLSMSIDLPPLSVTDVVSAGRYELTQKFEIVALRDSRLFAANQPVQGGEFVTIRAAEDDPTARLPRGIVPNYEVTSWAPHVSVRELDSDSTDYPAEIRAHYLQLPDNLPQRVKDLAERITHGATSPYDKAIRLQEYLRATYPYKLDVPPPPSGRDVVDYFLFDAPGGFCSYYASAMTVMLRSQGVPARLVVGFATGEYDGLLRKYRVEANAAHAWVEAYFPTYGWIEFEPTSSRTTFVYAQGETPLTERPPEGNQGQSADVGTTLIMIGSSLALLLGIAVLAVIYMRRTIAQSRLAPEVQARRLYWSTRRSLMQIGVGGAASATPDEFRVRCARRLADQPRLLHAIETATALYIRAVFTDVPPLGSDVNAARRTWRSTWRERLRLRWRRMWSR